MELHIRPILHKISNSQQNMIINLIAMLYHLNKNPKLTSQFSPNNLKQKQNLELHHQPIGSHWSCPHEASSRIPIVWSRCAPCSPREQRRHSSRPTFSSPGGFWLQKPVRRSKKNGEVKNNLYLLGTWKIVTLSNLIWNCLSNLFKFVCVEFVNIQEKNGKNTWP